MSRTIARCLVFFASFLAGLLAASAQAQAAISLGEISNRASFDRGLVTHFVGTSADGHQVDATFLQSSLDTTLPAINGLFQPGESISLFGSIRWKDDFNGGLTVDGTSYPAGTPPYVFSTLAPTGDGIHGTPVNPFFQFNGSVLAPAAPADPTVPQTMTVLAPFTYSAIDVMESLVNPQPSPVEPVLVDPLFYFHEEGGTGLVELELSWSTGGPVPFVWRGENIHYSFSSAIVPEPGSMLLWAFAITGLAGWRRWAAGRRRGEPSR